MSVIDTAEILLGRKLSDEEYLQAAVLGWGVEMVCAIGLSFTSFFSDFAQASSVLPCL